MNGRRRVMAAVVTLVIGAAALRVWQHGTASRGRGSRAIELPALQHLPAPGAQLPMTRSLNIAVREIRRQWPALGDFLDENQFRLSVSRDEKEREWSFAFTWLPEASGSETFVTVADDGKTEVLDGF
jgi:hypothetical protein